MNFLKFRNENVILFIFLEKIFIHCNKIKKEMNVISIIYLLFANFSKKIYYLLT